METSYPLQRLFLRILNACITRRHRLWFDFIQFSSSIRHHYVHCGLYTLGYKNDYVCVYTDKSLNVYTWNMVYWAHDISKLTEECSNEEDVDKKIEILYKINYASHVI